MRRELYDFLFELRASGFQHHTPESVQMLMATPFHKGFFDSIDQLDGERGSLSGNRFRDMKNYMIGCCFQCAQSLIQAGVDAEYAYGLSDYYINQLDSIRDAAGLVKLAEEMFPAVVELLDSRRPPSRGALVDKCIRFIDQKLYSPLSASDVAAYAGKHPSYLSEVFRQKVGVPLHRYILQQKLQEGQTMLRFTDRPVSEISDALCFSSPGHFSTLFKRHTGLTPTQYRQQINAPPQPQL